MTISETYNYLKQVRRLDWTIRRLTLEHDELQACLLPSAIRYDKDVVQVSPEDKLSTVAAMVLELEKRIIRLQEQKAAAITEIMRAVDQLPNEKEGTVLTAYYINKMTMEKVAEELDMSMQHTYRLRKRGVQHLSIILRNK